METKKYHQPSPEVESVVTDIFSAISEVKTVTELFLWPFTKSPMRFIIFDVKLLLSYSIFLAASAAL